MKELEFFITSLNNEGIDTNSILNELNDFFDGDEIPIVFLMGELGRAIYCSNLPAESQKNIFSLIEDAVNSNNSNFSDAVATGLLESYANIMWEHEKNVSKLDIMGINTRKYVMAYLEI